MDRGDYSPWDPKESDPTEKLTHTRQQLIVKYLYEENYKTMLKYIKKDSIINYMYISITFIDKTQHYKDSDVL